MAGGLALFVGGLLLWRGRPTGDPPPPPAPTAAAPAENHDAAPPPAQTGLAPGWRLGPTLDADGFHLAVLEPDKLNFGVGERTMTGQFDSAAPGYWVQRIKLVELTGSAPENTLRFYPLAGDKLQPGTETHLPDGYPDGPLLAWPDGRVLSLVVTPQLKELTAPVARSYTLVQPVGAQLSVLERYSYTGTGPAASFPARFTDVLQLLERDESPTSAPFPVTVWLCPPGAAGHALPPLSAVATGNGWRGDQRINVIVDAQGQVLVPNTAGTQFAPDPQWQAAAAQLAKADSHFRMVALASDLLVVDSTDGEQLVARDGSQHLLRIDTSGHPPMVADPGGKSDQTQAVDVCGPNCRIRALDEHTVVVKDDSFNRLILIRRG